MPSPTFGVLANIWDPDTATVIERVCLAADELGYDYLAFSDHLGWHTPEAWSVLAWAAGITTRVRLTHLVLNNTYRHPCLLAKMGATLDFLSGGRYELGIGAGSADREEYHRYGLTYLPFEERVARLREALTIVTELWETGRCDHEGDYFDIEDAVLAPMPVQSPRPPVLVGGRSEALMDIAVSYEGWNFGFDRSPDACRDRLESFDDRCSQSAVEPGEVDTPVGVMLIIADTQATLVEKIRERASREDLSPEEFRRRYSNSFIGTPDAVVSQVEAYLDLGVEDFFIWGPSVRDPDALELFATDVVPEIG